MEPGAGKAALGGIKDFQPTVGLPLDIGATHLNPPFRMLRCTK
jgi:hypothetical protein